MSVRESTEADPFEPVPATPQNRLMAIDNKLRACEHFHTRLKTKFNYLAMKYRPQVIMFQEPPDSVNWEKMTILGGLAAGKNYARQIVWVSSKNKQVLNAVIKLEKQINDNEEMHKQLEKDRRQWLHNQLYKVKESVDEIADNDPFQPVNVPMDSKDLMRYKDEQDRQLGSMFNHTSRQIMNVIINGERDSRGLAPIFSRQMYLTHGFHPDDAVEIPVPDTITNERIDDKPYYVMADNTKTIAWLKRKVRAMRAFRKQRYDVSAYLTRMRGLSEAVEERDQFQQISDSEPSWDRKIKACTYEFNHVQAKIKKLKEQGRVLQTYQMDSAKNSDYCWFSLRTFGITGGHECLYVKKTDTDTIAKMEDLAKHLDDIEKLRVYVSGEHIKHLKATK